MSTHPVSRRHFLGTALASGAVSHLVANTPAHAQAPAPASGPKLKIGLIGCGGRGAWLGGLFKQHGGFEIHALTDYFADVSNQAGEFLGVPAERRFSGFHGYQRVLESGVDAVAIVNIPRFHAEHARAAIAAGVHVYAAKPVAIDVPTALVVEAAGKQATAKKLVHFVDYQMPTDPVNQEVVKRIREGALGRLMHIDSQGFSGVWPDPADRTPESLLRRGNWLTALPLSGDFIVEYSVHTINAVLWAVGQPRPVKAYGLSRRVRANAHGEGRDLYLVTYEFADGLAWTHRCQALNNIQDNHIRCEISGDRAYAMIPYAGRAFLRGGPQQYGGGPVENLYNAGATRNIATFHKLVRDGDCTNPTVQLAVNDALTGILGREAATRETELTMEALLAENRALEFDTSQLKA